MTFVAMGMVSFPTQGNADFIFDQSKAVAVNSSVNNLGEAGERTSYFGVYDEQPDGTLVPVRLWHKDSFAIVRETPIDPTDPPAWIQPTGAQDSYPALDVRGNTAKVTHNGSTWTNTHGNGNSWAPGVFGWTQE